MFKKTVTCILDVLSYVQLYSVPVKLSSSTGRSVGRTFQFDQSKLEPGNKRETTSPGVPY